ncbi:prealbumin-like fold domain-containing protein [Propioniciclava flava]
MGAFTVTGLTWGSYTLNETVAPPGYGLRSLTPIPFTVGAGQTPGAGASVALGTLLNKKTPPVLLPLTGGMGMDAYLVAGGALLALAISVAVVAKRSTRKPHDSQ